MSGMSTKRATCHPDLKHYAKGKCLRCYEREDRCEARRKQALRRYERQKDKILAHQRSRTKDIKAKRLERVYQISAEDYNVIYDFQDGRCPLCDKILANTFRGIEGKLPSVDHDHTSGEIRGLLCAMPCNRYLNSNLQLAKNTLKYLTTPPAATAMGKKIFTLPGQVETKRRIGLFKKYGTLPNLRDVGLWEALRIHAEKETTESAGLPQE